MQFSAELQISHKCKWIGCTDWSCVLCRQNSNRCFHDLCPSQILRSTRRNDRNGVASSRLKSDCKEPFSVVLAAVSPGCQLDRMMPTHLQLSLLDSSDGQSVQKLACQCTGEELESFIRTRRLDIPHLLKAEVQGSGTSSYEENQLIIPFDTDDNQREEQWSSAEARGHESIANIMGRLEDIWSEMCTGSQGGTGLSAEHALKNLKNQDGSSAKTLTLVIRGVMKDNAGKWYQLQGLKPYVSQPFTFFTRRRDDKGVIPTRRTKVDDLPGMADATVKKLRDLSAHVPAHCDLDPRVLPAMPIETAGELYDFLKPLPKNNLERISNKVLGRSKYLLQTVRDNLEERMITIENDSRSRIWCHLPSNLGLIFAARNGSLVPVEEILPRAICLSTLESQDMPEADLERYAQQAMLDWFSPAHGDTWHIHPREIGQPEHDVTGQATSFKPVSTGHSAEDNLSAGDSHDGSARAPHSPNFLPGRLLATQTGSRFENDQQMSWALQHSMGADLSLQGLNNPVQAELIQHGFNIPNFPIQTFGMQHNQSSQSPAMTQPFSPASSGNPETSSSPTARQPFQFQAVSTRAKRDSPDLSPSPLLPNFKQHSPTSTSKRIRETDLEPVHSVDPFRGAGQAGLPLHPRQQAKPIFDSTVIRSGAQRPQQPSIFATSAAERVSLPTEDYNPFEQYLNQPITQPRAEQSGTGHKASGRNQHTSAMPRAGADMSNVQTSTSTTVTLGAAGFAETPSEMLIRKFDSNTQLPIFPSMKSGPQRPDGSQLTDRLFDCNLQPLGTLLPIQRAGISGSPSVTMTDQLSTPQSSQASLPTTQSGMLLLPESKSVEMSDARRQGPELNLDPSPSAALLAAQNLSALTSQDKLMMAISALRSSTDGSSLDLRLPGLSSLTADADVGKLSFDLATSPFGPLGSLGLGSLASQDGQGGTQLLQHTASLSAANLASLSRTEEVGADAPTSPWENPLQQQQDNRRLVAEEPWQTETRTASKSSPGNLSRQTAEQHPQKLGEPQLPKLFHRMSIEENTTPLLQSKE